MKRILVVSSLALLASACSSSLDKQLGYNECTYPDAPNHDAPTWICEKPIDGIHLQAVGYSRELASGPGMMKDVAAAEARVYLAANFATDIQARYTRLASDNMTDGDSEVIDNIENLTENLTAMNLKHSRIYTTSVSPNGGMYVLVGLDKVSYESNVEALLALSGQ